MTCSCSNRGPLSCATSCPAARPARTTPCPSWGPARPGAGRPWCRRTSTPCRPTAPRASAAFCASAAWPWRRCSKPKRASDMFSCATWPVSSGSASTRPRTSWPRCRDSTKCTSGRPFAACGKDNLSKPPSPQPPLRRVEALRLERGLWRTSREELAREAPCEIRLQGRSFVLLMVTPADLEHLARGFCLSEGVVSDPDQIKGLSLGQDHLPGLGAVHWVDVELAPGLAKQARARRVAPAATSCGLCGLESFRDLGAGIAQVKAPLQVELAVIQAQFQAMEQGQDIYRRSGAAHAAALGAPAGELLCLAEDVGRHNALDKVLGMALAQGRDLGTCLCTVSGRISMEMALKAARTGLPLIGSVSAATALGQSLCADLGVTVVGFAREDRATVYCHPQRVLINGRPLDRRTQGRASRFVLSFPAFLSRHLEKFHMSAPTPSICGMAPEEYLFKVEEFHGHVSPGTTMGGFLVNAAWDILGDVPFINAVVETVVCLPDAVQLLTPCTLGNGFLQLLDWGKFAVTLYDRQSLEGARAWVDVSDIERYPLVAGWFLRRPEAGEVDKALVVRQILDGGHNLVSARQVRMNSSLKTVDKIMTGPCAACGEYHPQRQGELCPSCAGDAYYELQPGYFMGVGLYQTPEQYPRGALRNRRLACQGMVYTQSRPSLLISLAIPFSGGGRSPVLFLGLRAGSTTPIAKLSVAIIKRLPLNKAIAVIARRGGRVGRQ
eukprot:TRINITY_DN2694_c1_g4_i1.p1 TRINITY_DN2694_c1_g4~~TRINITY_DN2694_c1_g4_i1.p1  ORF type:complete len:724 (-),score=167.23 TRINITY_DN2694_c1_g4_i1:78-2249(-)